MNIVCKREPARKDILEIELKHFGPIYGKDFTIRNVDHLYEYMDFRGAYLGEKLVGAYYFYSANGYTCLDGLIVDEDDTPKEMYEKLGFRVVDRLFEYL